MSDERPYGLETYVLPYEEPSEAVESLEKARELLKQFIREHSIYGSFAAQGFRPLQPLYGELNKALRNFRQSPQELPIHDAEAAVARSINGLVFPEITPIIQQMPYEEGWSDEERTRVLNEAKGHLQDAQQKLVAYVGSPQSPTNPGDFGR